MMTHPRVHGKGESYRKAMDILLKCYRGLQRIQTGTDRASQQRHSA